MGKFSRTWSLMSASWEILKKDKEMLVFPLFSGICCLLVMASFAIPLFTGGNWQPPGDHAAASEQITYYGLLFLFYFCNYLVIVFFNAAVIACATIRMEGGDPTVSDGFRAAWARLPAIAGWALVSATVGLVLRIIEDRSDKLGKLVAGLLGVSWSVVSFLVIPILVMENETPITALKKSAMLLKQTWGEGMISTFSFGLIFFLLSIPAFLLIILGFLGGKGMTMIISISLAAIYFIIIALIQSALQTVFQAALYFYARRGQAPEGFQRDLLVNSMTRR